MTILEDTEKIDEIIKQYDKKNENIGNYRRNRKSCKFSSWLKLILKIICLP